MLPLLFGDVPIVAPPKHGLIAALETQLNVREIDLAALELVLLREPVLDGLPRRWPESRSNVPYEEAWARLVGERSGLPFRQMQTAFLFDIENWSSVAAGDQLGHVTQAPYQRLAKHPDIPGRQYAVPRGRSAERYRGSGRRLLHAVGAWPWALSRDGALPRGWHTQEPFLTALSEWHRRGWESTATDLFASLEHLNGHGGLMRSAAANQRARDLYRALCQSP